VACRRLPSPGLARIGSFWPTYIASCSSEPEGFLRSSICKSLETPMTREYVFLVRFFINKAQAGVLRSRPAAGPLAVTFSFITRVTRTDPCCFVLLDTITKLKTSFLSLAPDPRCITFARKCSASVLPQPRIQTLHACESTGFSLLAEPQVIVGNRCAEIDVGAREHHSKRSCACSRSVETTLQKRCAVAAGTRRTHCSSRAAAARW